MPDDLVTLEIQFAAGGDDEAAKLCWVADGGAEQQYSEVRVRASISQETFPGHRWVLRGTTTNRVIWDCTAAAAPAVQVHTVRVRPGAAAEGAEPGALPDAAEAEAPVEEAEVEGVWQDTAGLHRFERLPGRGRDGQILWRQVDASRRETARLEQLEARVDTRWLWWTRAILSRLTPHVTGEREHLIMCALTIFSAYRLDESIPWPAAVREAAARIGPQPAALLIACFVLVTCSIAAAVPYRDTSLLLFNTTERVEVRLNDTHGHSREPSNRPGYVNSWTRVCEGTFAVLPADLKAKQGQRGFHAAFILGAAAAIVSACMRGLGPPRSTADRLIDELLTAAAEE